MSHKKPTPAELAQAAQDAVASGAQPLTKQGQRWVEKLREYVRAEAETAPLPPAPSFADYLRAIEERRAFDPSARRGELYADGDCIAEFVRIRADDKAAAAFRARYPHYFPSQFWQWSLPSYEQLYAGGVVLPGPGVDQAAALTTPDSLKHYGTWNDDSLGDPIAPDDMPSGLVPTRAPFLFWQAYRDVLRAAWGCGFADEYVVRLLNVPTRAEDAEDFFKQQVPALPRTRTLEFSPLFPFQRDILTLVRSTWRAKICDYNQCLQPFVADKPSRCFCPTRYAIRGETCYALHRREYKRDLWKKHGKEWRKPAKGKGRRKKARR